MAYFSREFLKFFKGLSKQNTREWFHAHRGQYELHVKGPFEWFVVEVINRLSGIDPSLDVNPKDAIFRLARDTRFSRDKTPYKTNMAAFISRGGRRTTKEPGFYFQLGVGGVLVGGGLYQPSTTDLVRIRRAIVSHGETFARLLQARPFRQLFGHLQGNQHKRLPREFAELAPKFPFIANKQFYYVTEYPDPDVINREDLAKFIVQHFRAGYPVDEFLRDALR